MKNDYGMYFIFTIYTHLYIIKWWSHEFGYPYNFFF